MRHYLRADDLTADQQQAVLDRAVELKADRAARLASRATLVRTDLRGQTVALIFEKPSLRTRASFEVAVHELGGHALPMWDFEVGLGKRETIADTAKVLSGYASAIVIRTFGQERIDELADNASVPVVNALTDLEHPCQALADLLTMTEEFGDLSGRRLAYVGDGNNVAHSLLIAGALAGMDVVVGHPDGYAPDEDILRRAGDIASRTGGSATATTDAVEAVNGASAVYGDVWTSMGQEAENEIRLKAFADYQVDAELFGHAADDAIFLHCLPAHRGEEVTAEVIDGSSSRVFSQAENRLHAQKGLLSYIFEPQG